MTTTTLNALQRTASIAIQALIDALEHDIQDLETEQQENEQERESAEEGEPEIDEVDHQALIDTLNEALFSVEEASDMIDSIVFEAGEEAK